MVFLGADLYLLSLHKGFYFQISLQISHHLALLLIRWACASSGLRSTVISPRAVSFSESSIDTFVMKTVFNSIHLEHSKVQISTIGLFVSVNIIKGSISLPRQLRCDTGTT